MAGSEFGEEDLATMAGRMWIHVASASPPHKIRRRCRCSNKQHQQGTIDTSTITITITPSSSHLHHHRRQNHRLHKLSESAQASDTALNRMICRALFPCVAAIIAALAYHPTAGVSAFSTNAPARLSTAAGGSALLKGAISSPSSSTIGTALCATKKGTSTTKKEKSTTKKKSESAAAAPKKTKPAEVEEEDDEVVKFKKADFVSALAEKTGMTKTQSDLALTAVLNVIVTVSWYRCCLLFSLLSHQS